MYDCYRVVANNGLAVVEQDTGDRMGFRLERAQTNLQAAARGFARRRAWGRGVAGGAMIDIQKVVIAGAGRGLRLDRRR